MGEHAGKPMAPLATNIYFDADMMHVVLADGRQISVPLEWLPRLRDATKDQRGRWRLVGGGIGIHWEDLDEDISVSELLAARRSTPAEGTWYRWVIVPGVELHIRSDLVKRYRHLIDVLRRASGETDV